MADRGEFQSHPCHCSRLASNRPILLILHKGDLFIDTEIQQFKLRRKTAEKGINYFFILLGYYR
jgi:hypothetical protein